LVVSAFAIGALAEPVFGLGFVDTILTIFFFNLLGILPVCFFSTFGPRFGLRQMVLSRFYFGWYGVKLSKLITNSSYSLYFRDVSEVVKSISGTLSRFIPNGGLFRETLPRWANKAFSLQNSSAEPETNASQLPSSTFSPVLVGPPSTLLSAPSFSML
jgi:hypothetical protein